MAADWLSKSSAVSERFSHSLAGLLRDLSTPRNARYLRFGLGVLLAIWAVFSLARVIWATLPLGDAAGKAQVVAHAEVINPLAAKAATTPQVAVDVEKMQNWRLFGEAGSLQPAVVVQQQVPREGIEEDARETRLQLVLRGVVASTEGGQGLAIIEHKRKQAVYAIEDKLPISGNVVLAKVLPRQVVLDNAGTYELLTLFEDSELASQEVQRKPVVKLPPVQEPKAVSAQTGALAQSYRQRLYENPQSLADVVSVSAVREGDKLLGYRISPGKDKAQFSELGFKAGDLVTRVNGVALNDPANTVRLYQTMRTATEAVFDLQRNDQPLSISVDLSSSEGSP